MVDRRTVSLGLHPSGHFHRTLSKNSTLPIASFPEKGMLSLRSPFNYIVDC